MQRLDCPFKSRTFQNWVCFLFILGDNKPLAGPDRINQARLETSTQDIITEALNVNAFGGKEFLSDFSVDLQGNGPTGLPGAAPEQPLI